MQRLGNGQRSATEGLPVLIQSVPTYRYSYVRSRGAVGSRIRSIPSTLTRMVAAGGPVLTIDALAEVLDVVRELGRTHAQRTVQQ
jgi:hypothetical protein